MSLAEHVLLDNHPHAPEYVSKRASLASTRRIENYWSVKSVSQDGVLFCKQKQQTWVVYVCDSTSGSVSLFNVHVMSLHRTTSALPVQTYTATKNLIVNKGTLSPSDITFELRAVKPSNEPTPYVRHWPPVCTTEPQTASMTASLDARLLAAPSYVAEFDIHNPYDLVFALTVKAPTWTNAFAVSRRIPREAITNAFMQDPTILYDPTKSKVFNGLTQGMSVQIENGGDTVIPAPTADCPEPLNTGRV